MLDSYSQMSIGTYKIYWNTEVVELLYTMDNNALWL